MKLSLKKLNILTLLISIWLLTWCGIKEQNNLEQPNYITSKPIKIVTTFTPLYSHVANLIDWNDEIVNLVPAGTSVHFRQTTPEALVAMQKADMIIINWLHLEEFLEKYVEELEKSWVKIIDTSIWIKTIEYEEEHNHEEEYNHEWADPHTRLDPNNAILQTITISNALSEIDPNQSEYYKSQEKIYISKLEKLEQEVREIIKPEEIKPFIVFHNAYQYFLHAFDIENKQIAVIKNFDWDNPSQKEIAELINIIKEKNVNTIFTEPQFNPSIITALNEEVSIQIKSIDPIWTELSKNWYINNMKSIAKTFSQN